jgi:hypothetical protein
VQALKELEHVFPPASALYRAMSWWQAQPDTTGDMKRAAAEFFGGEHNMPREEDEERAPDMWRFTEWYMIDRETAQGGSPVARYAAQVGADEREQLAGLLESRHNAWRVARAAEGEVELTPMGGGTGLVVVDENLARDARMGEWIIGRIYPWEGAWMPSLSLFFVPGLNEPPGLKEMDALVAQRIFFDAQSALTQDPEAAAAELAEALVSHGVKLEIAALREMAGRHDSVEGFIAAFSEAAGTALIEDSESQLADSTRLGALLTNLWYHAPQEGLGGRSPAEVDAGAEDAIVEVVEALFDALAQEDESAVLQCLYPEGEVALVYDMWGWAGLRLITDWNGPTPDREVTLTGPDMGAMGVEVRWKGPQGTRGATVWLVEHLQGWGVVESVPELESEEAVNPQFLLAQDKGQTPPWRGAAPDPVEQKLRNSIAARKLPMLDQAAMIKAWRMTASLASRDPGQPEAWAAAVETMFRAMLEQDISTKQVADFYGANKSLVKERFQVLAEAFNQQAVE